MAAEIPEYLKSMFAIMMGQKEPQMVTGALPSAPVAGFSPAQLAAIQKLAVNPAASSGLTPAQMFGASGGPMAGLGGAVDEFGEAVSGSPVVGAGVAKAAKGAGKAAKGVEGLKGFSAKHAKQFGTIAGGIVAMMMASQILNLLPFSAKGIERGAQMDMAKAAADSQGISAANVLQESRLEEAMIKRQRQLGIIQEAQGAANQANAMAQQRAMMQQIEAARQAQLVQGERYL
jgi:hypothetical protein